MASSSDAGFPAQCALPEWLGEFLSAAEVLAVACAARGGLCAGYRAPVRHLRLDRRGGDGRDAAALEHADWTRLRSLCATHTSLYAVHGGLGLACALLRLDVELLFPEPWEDILPSALAATQVLRHLVLRRCYDEVLAGLADALAAGAMPRLRSLALLGSPKGAEVRSRGLQWPPRRSGLAPAEPSLDAARALASAVAGRAEVCDLSVDGAVSFGGGAGEALLDVAGRPSMRRLCLVGLSCLGHGLLLATLAALAAAGAALEALSLAPTPLCAEPFGRSAELGAEAAEVVARCPTLRVLRLRWCALGDVGAVAFCARLEAMAPSSRPRLALVDLAHSSVARLAPRLAAAVARVAPRLGALCLDADDAPPAADG